MAELLEMLITIYDFQQLADSVLREVSTKEFEESIKDITVPKAYSKFLVRLSELAPKVVLKQMGLLIDHLDGEVSLLRHDQHCAQRYDMCGSDTFILFS